MPGAPGGPKCSPPAPAGPSQWEVTERSLGVGIAVPATSIFRTDHFITVSYRAPNFVRAFLLLFFIL